MASEVFLTVQKNECTYKYMDRNGQRGREKCLLLNLGEGWAGRIGAILSTFLLA